jgi:hypothetical protein
LGSFIDADQAPKKILNAEDAEIAEKTANLCDLRVLCV